MVDGEEVAVKDVWSGVVGVGWGLLRDLSKKLKQGAGKDKSCS